MQFRRSREPNRMGNLNRSNLIESFLGTHPRSESRHTAAMSRYLAMSQKYGNWMKFAGDFQSSSRPGGWPVASRAEEEYNLPQKVKNQSGRRPRMGITSSSFRNIVYWIGRKIL